MCIRAVKKEGIGMPSDAVIRKMFSQNSHGAGFMVKRKRSKLIEISKGHMTLEDFKAAIVKAKIKETDIVVMHFRIATAGGRSQRLTHPFVAVENADDAEILSGKTDQLCLAHNGTISEYSRLDSNRSDSSLFASKIMSSKAIQDNLDDAVIQELITDKLSGTRIAVINPVEHKVHIFGGWAEKYGGYEWNEDETTGMIYSNYTWVPDRLKHYRGYTTDYYGDQEEYSTLTEIFDKQSPIDQSLEPTNNHGASAASKARDFTTPAANAGLYGNTDEANLILEDFEQLSPEWQGSFLSHIEMTKAEFRTSVNAGMTINDYTDLCVEWMNTLGYSDPEPESKTNYSVGKIKTADGWDDVPTKDEHDYDSSGK